MRDEPSAADRAYADIKGGIVRGELAAGTMLGEVTLAARTGVSRTPVRAALTRLQDEGWIVIYPQRGALVLGLDRQAIADLREARWVLESSAVQLATADARAALAVRLSSSLAAQRAALQASDVDAFVDETIRFHQAFAAAAGNQVLVELSERLSDRLRSLLYRHGDRLAERCPQILAEHEDLVAQLTVDDGAHFPAALARHLAETDDL
ncbi:GntR family transcriptional regulator [Cellulomonas sp. NPDC089187]|uniref:GntR family transcriptional regulator n=1 Tax=Cellulomonas sp. NPDC089187 TaxID=3154970 RepID=UPI003417D889